MKTLKKLIFFGTEDFSAVVLKALLGANYTVVAVVTKPDSQSGRGRRLKSPKVKEIAQKAKIRVFQPAKMLDIKDEIKNFNPKFGILVAYGKILPQEIIDIFPDGIINAHPSLLPKYRGPTPIETAILNGDETTGISLIKLTAGMDEGPIYAQKILKITPVDDRISLTEKVAQECANYLLKILPKILSGELQPKSQDHAGASYTKLLTKADGLVNQKKSAAQIEREVRAYAGWPRSRAKIDGHAIIITKGRVAKDEGDGGLIMKCGRGYLEIQELIAPSGRKMSGADFIRGYRR